MNFLVIRLGQMCYENIIIQRADMTHKHISYEIFAVIFTIPYLRVVVI
jgi:hypothetical protein